MKKNTVSLVIIFFFFTSIMIIGCGKSDQHEEMQSESSKRAVDSTLIRSDTIDVATLDVNDDGNVYQCPMHFNVISDKAESCPECMMDLEEISVADAKKNLNGNDSHTH